jgi:outer membrane protein assembly factor BamB
MGVGAMFVAVAVALYAVRPHYPVWSSFPMIGAYVAFTAAVACFGGAVWEIIAKEPARELLLSAVHDQVQQGRPAGEAKDSFPDEFTEAGAGAGRALRAVSKSIFRRVCGISRRRLVITAAVAGSAVIGLLIAVSIPSGPSPTADPSGEISRAPAWMYKTKDPVRCNPLVAGGTVYIGSNDHHVYALSAATGRRIWAHATKDEVRSRPAVVGDTVYVGSDDGTVYALNTANGDPRWARHTKGPVLSSPAVVDGTVYVGSEDGKVYALNALNGHVRWAHPTNWHVVSSPVVVDGTVYVGSKDDKVYALNATNGHVRWTYATRGWVETAPAVADGTVYAGSRDGTVYALNAINGRLRSIYATQGAVESSPVVADGTIYVGSDDDNVYALKTAGS